MKNILLIALALISTLALAEDRINIGPQSIIITPTPPAPPPPPPPPVHNLKVDLWLNKRGHYTPTYRIGEKLEIGVRTNEDAYVYLFNLHTDGTIRKIFPNRYDNHNYLRANQTKYLPKGRYSFYVDGPTGHDKVIAVASKKRLSRSTLASFRSEHDFSAPNYNYQGYNQQGYNQQGYNNYDNYVQGHNNQDSYARSLSIVVEPTNPYYWVTDTANFYIKY